ncbi:MAG: N(5)-(carboxyethyl)ornithine synthase [Candidatus Thermoplasmatota archaeon]|jgi:alanine dehydrogenase|nr:N(5)-(carboxyethyl)ornithine synthase [Candidatus Thermoplasmatota archaeon]MDP7265959.1 N(5)-(carboxyethyl)ornithine synthase [Candidatus Thermoplasmatota archaeon]
MNDDELKMGVIGSSKKENEHRVPIFPSHLLELDGSLRKRIYIEEGYGERFGVPDEELKKLVAGVMTRELLFEKSDIVLLPKPTKGDFSHFQEGQILWGWPHCVQGEPITQVGIDKKMTFIAWEAMYIWKKDEFKDLHIFHKNNEMAGYCSVLHAIGLAGMTGHYGPAKRAAVISFGSTGRGAIHALMGLGYTDITLFTQRPEYSVIAPIPSVKHGRYMRKRPESSEVLVTKDNNTILITEELASYDIIVNCILQDTDKPLMFVRNTDLCKLKPGALIIDVSCDLGMGFEFARPTSFEEPNFMIDKIIYYAVDHSPSYLWRSASYEISSALLPFIETVMGGKEAWEKDPTIRKAIEIENGRILNPKIISFQNRTNEYPYPKLS